MSLDADEKKSCVKTYIIIMVLTAIKVIRIVCVIVIKMLLMNVKHRCTQTEVNTRTHKYISKSVHIGTDTCMCTRSSTNTCTCTQMVASNLPVHLSAVMCGGVFVF